MVLQTLIQEFFRVLERSGRDWHRIRSAITGLEREVRASAQGSPWQQEEREYLSYRVCEALAWARKVAVANEEFEWAHEITLRLQELGWEEKEVAKLTRTDV